MTVRKIGNHIFDIINYSALTILAFLCLYPILHVLFSSFSQPDQLNAAKGLILRPLGFSTKGYELALYYPGFFRAYGNTIFYLIAGTLCNVIATGLLAYVLANKCFWNKAIMIFVLITMFFNGGLIPTFLLVKSMGLLNTRLAIIIPSLISVWNLIIMRTFFMGIPDSLEESARMDGATPLRIFFRIIIPLSKPVIAVMVLYYGVRHWNSWFSAMIYLQDRALYPLQLFLRQILIQDQLAGSAAGAVENYESALKGVNQEILEAAFIVIATLPILFLYPFLQKYFIKGVLIGALKG